MDSGFLDLSKKKIFEQLNLYKICVLQFHFQYEIEHSFEEKYPELNCIMVLNYFPININLKFIISQAFYFAFISNDIKLVFNIIKKGTQKATEFMFMTE